MRLEYRSFLLSDAKAKDEPGKFTGKASVYGVIDSYGDVVMPGAFTKTLAERGSEIVVLSQHDPTNSIGKAQLADSADALLITDGRLELELASARDEYIRLKSGLITGISIGYVTRDARFEQGVRQLTEIDLWEVSLVTFPANDFARVTGVKANADPFAAIERAYIEAQRIKSLIDEIKAGRTLSAENEKRVRGAFTLLKEIVDFLDADKSKAEDQPVKPNEDGSCPAGMEMGDDGMCHMMPAKRRSEIEAERLALVAVSETLGKLLNK